MSHRSRHSRHAHVPVLTTVSAVTLACLLPATGTQAAPNTSTPAGQALAASSRPRPDFNGDGFRDLAISAGDAITVTYSVGLDEPDPATSEILRLRDTGAGLGVALAAGDFDGDGFDDLAVGAPLDDDSSGSVWVYPGSADGLASPTGASLPHQLRQGVDGLPGTPEQEDSFGTSLVAGDLIGGTEDDLAIGAPGDAVGTAAGAGTATVLSGSTSGLTTEGALVLSQDSPEVAGAAEAQDAFGTGMAAGDVTGDGQADLVIGAPRENFLGVVHLFPQVADGPTGTGSSYVSAKTLKIKATPLSALDPEATGSDAGFGATLAVADTNGDGLGDVAAGAPVAKAGTVAGCGAVAVLRGAATGISGSRGKVLTPSSTGVAGACAKGLAWASSLTAGDLTGDRRAEVVVGAPEATVNQRKMAGSYTVLRSTSSGVTATGSFVVTQNTRGIPGTAEMPDSFGFSLALFDLNGDSRLDVVAGSPLEATGEVPTGAAVLIPSSGTGRPSSGAVVLTGKDFPAAVPVFSVGMQIAPAPAS